MIKNEEVFETAGKRGTVWKNLKKRKAIGLKLRTKGLLTIILGKRMIDTREIVLLAGQGLLAPLARFEFYLHVFT